MNSEIIFVVEEDMDGGYTARALGHSIFTEAETWDELKAAVQDAVRTHFDEHNKPGMVRLRLENIVAGVCAIPANMSNMSFTTSVHLSGYREHAAEITQAQLVSYLRAHPEFTNSWLLWSGDKRSSGAFILPRGDHLRSERIRRIHHFLKDRLMT